MTQPLWRSVMHALGVWGAMAFEVSFGLVF